MNKIVIITGASDGLGAALADLYVKQGKRVIGLSRSKCADGIEWLETDLENAQSINDAVKKIVNKEAELEALINCAGVLSIEKIESLSTTEVDRVFNTNVRAPMLLTSELIEKIKKDGADIVNVASTVGFKGNANEAAYGASKWALRGFSANLQTELKNYPSRVISFCPGGFKSKLFKKATGEDFAAQGSWMDAAEVAKFLKQVLDLPKIMEVTEVVINRKQAK